jgi:hypothetical protein
MNATLKRQSLNDLRDGLPQAVLACSAILLVWSALPGTSTVPDAPLIVLAAQSMAAVAATSGVCGVVFSLLTAGVYFFAQVLS